MKRFALIIEASEVPGEDKLAGAKADAEAYHAWLNSRPGGEWYEREVRVLHTPRVAEVKAAIAAAGKVDYAFVTFSGHGFHSEELDQTKVCLLGGEMTVRDLVPDADRSTVVVDACRKVMPEVFPGPFQLSLTENARFAKAAQARNYRLDFEHKVAAGERGPIFLYSCDLDESAGESRFGGFFSRYLVEAGRTFADEHTDGKICLLMNNAFAIAAEYTNRRERTQNPQYEPGRRRVHFPFAV